MFADRETRARREEWAEGQREKLRQTWRVVRLTLFLLGVAFACFCAYHAGEFSGYAAQCLNRPERSTP